MIVLPQIDYTANGMETELRDVLRHELTHWRRHDILYKWFVVLVQSVHWFNPVVYFIRREIDKSCELSCDEAVVRGLSEQDRISYGNTLLALASERAIPRRIPATTLSERKKQLKERIISIRDYKKSTRTMVALMLVMAIALTGCATAIAAVGKEIDGQEKETVPVSGWLYGDGTVLSYVMEHYDIDGKKIVSGTYQETGRQDGGDYKRYTVGTEDGETYLLTAHGELKPHYFLFWKTGQRGPEFRVTGISFAAIPSYSTIPAPPVSDSPFEDKVTGKLSLAHSQSSAEVPYPRVEVYLHVTGGYYYIQIPDDLEKQIQDAFDSNIALDGIEPNTEVLGQEWYSQDIYLPQVFYVHNATSRYTAIVQCKDGRVGLGNIEATAAASELLSLVEDIMGWNLHVSLSDFTNLNKIEIWIGDDFLFELSDEAQLDAFEEFLQYSVVPDIAGKTQEHLVEFRCFSSSDNHFSIIADPWMPRLWLPPSYYYRYDKTDGGAAEALMNILGIEDWPESVLRPEEYPYPDGFFDGLYERVGALPPSWQNPLTFTQKQLQSLPASERIRDGQKLVTGTVEAVDNLQIQYSPADGSTERHTTMNGNEARTIFQLLESLECTTIPDPLHYEVFFTDTIFQIEVNYTDGTTDIILSGGESESTMNFYRTLPEMGSHGDYGFVYGKDETNDLLYALLENISDNFLPNLTTPMEYLPRDNAGSL